jgi:hypothetical protein
MSCITVSFVGTVQVQHRKEEGKENALLLA